MARTELPNGVILPAEYSDDWYEDMTSNLTKLDDVIGSDSEKLNSNDVAFLRMSSAALTDGGTGNFSDLNSSNKLKTGDYVLDSGRKLYQVVSVDSTNETFTVGNSLFKITAESDLAPVAESGDYDDLDNKPDLNPYDQHIVNTDIHVTTADKTKWNNGVSQSYVLRYSSSSVTDNSTIAYSTLDNTDNIKSGDKILDVDGKLFEITAVDTTNQTVTVGSALIDLALDANVVHTSGNETVGGNKTFGDTLSIYKSDPSANTPSLNLRTAKFVKGDTSNTDVIKVNFVDANNQTIASVHANKNTGGSQYLVFQTNTTDDNNLDITSIINFYIAKSGYCYFTPYVDAQISLGTNVRKWKDVKSYLINGLTPSSLGMPSDRSARIDISGYFTNTANGDTNTYTVPVNGWIYLNLNDVVVAHCFAQTAGNLSHYGQTFARASAGQLHCLFPVRKDDVFVSQWYTTTTVTVTNAYFVPCLGNI